MKIFPLSLTSAALAAALTACGGSTPPPAVVNTSDLNITVTGVNSAPVKVTNAAGDVKFNDTVTGSKTITALPKDKYTVTGAAIANFVAPAPVTADLSSGNGSATLTYTPLTGQVLALDKVQGTFGDPLAKGGVLGVFLSQSILTSANVSADGSVTLPLTTPPASELYSFLPPAGSNCSYTGTGAGNTGKIYDADLGLFSSQGDYLGDVLEVPQGSSTAVLLHTYANSAQTYQGTITCANPSVRYVLNLQMATGWNALILDGDSNGNYTMTSAPADTRVRLELKKATAAVSMSLDTPSLTIKAGESVTANATFYQDGGISGKIDLSTDVPGLTIEPASVTLPALGTQNVKTRSLMDRVAITAQGPRPLKVGTQKLTTVLTFKAAADASSFNGSMNLIAKQGNSTVGKLPVALSLIVPSISAALPSGSSVTVERYQSVPLTIQITGQGFYKGAVQLALTGLPTGMTATTATVTFTGNTYTEQQSAQIVLTASGNAAVGSQNAQLTVTGGGKTTTSALTVQVPTPAYAISFPTSNSGYLYQGQSKSIDFTLQSVRGFSGPVTLKVQGLPQGVLAEPVTVQTPPNQKINGTFILQANSASTLGRTLISLSGVDMIESSSSTPIEIRPAVLSTLNNEPVKVTPAHDGFWMIGDAQAGIAQGQYVLPVKRINASGTILNTKLNIDSSSVNVLSSPEGDLILIGNSKVFRMNDDGTTVSFSPFSQVLFSLSSSPAVVDSQNKLWFYYFANGYQLFTLNLNSGELLSVRSENTNNGITQLYRNPVGDTIYVTGLDNGLQRQVRQFKTLSGENRLLSIGGANTFPSAYAVSADGGLWIKNDTSLINLSAAGTLSAVDNSSKADHMVFDGNQILWMTKKGGDTIWRFDPRTNQTMDVPVGSYVDSTPVSSGGLWVISLENSSSSNAYLSLLK